MDNWTNNFEYRNLEVFNIESDLLKNAYLLKEDDFREAVEKYQWNRFKGKEVLIKGCGNVVIPVWAYMIVATRLQEVSRAVYFGESSKPIPVWYHESVMAQN